MEISFFDRQPLNLSRIEITELLGGRIEVLSQVGHGSGKFISALLSTGRIAEIHRLLLSKFSDSSSKRALSPHLPPSLLS